MTGILQPNMPEDVNEGATEKTRETRAMSIGSDSLQDVAAFDQRIFNPYPINPMKRTIGGILVEKQKCPSKRVKIQNTQVSSFTMGMSAYLEQMWDSYLFSVRQETNQPLPDELSGHGLIAPTIKQFADKLWDLALQSEVACVIAFIYLERLSARNSLSVCTFHKTIAIMLLISNKMWEDDHFGNASFVSAFSGWDIQNVNSGEVVCLKLMEYDLGVTRQQFGDMYTTLRNTLR